jgi:hypothetical protein
MLPQLKVCKFSNLVEVQFILSHGEMMYFSPAFSMKDTEILIYFLIKQDGSSSNAVEFYMGIAMFECQLGH